MSKYSEKETGYIPNEVYRVKMFGNSYKLMNSNDEKVGTLGINTSTRKKAYNNGQALQAYITNTGRKQYRRVDMDVYNSLVSPIKTERGEVQVEKPENHQEIQKFIHKESIKLKPTQLVMSELKWKFLVRSAVRAKNILMVGPSGCGKTLAAQALIEGLERPHYYFNLGATQDSRATLIGNTHFNSDEGTFFSESTFVKAIKTPNSIILLDELTRAHPDAWNILMTVLDENQRYLRLDEAENSPTVKVAEGVTFVATANIGNEYTSTRVLDRAIKDRFTRIEMDVLDDIQEFELLKYMYPDVKESVLKSIAQIAHHTREQSISEDGKLTEMISTRASVETASLIYDGFTLDEASEISILPYFSNDGGNASERTYVKQLIQKHMEDESEEKLFNDDLDEEEDLILDDTIPQF